MERRPSSKACSARTNAAVQSFNCLLGAIRKQVASRLETEQQPVKTLQKRVMQVSRDPCTLTDSRLQSHGELLMQLPDT